MNKRYENKKEKNKKAGFFKSLMKNFYPTYIYEKVENIPSKLMKDNDIKLILIDMDNTLIDNKHIYNDKLKKWIKNIKDEGVLIYIFSNSPLGNTVKKIAAELDIKYEYNVSKPGIKRFKKICEELNMNKENILMIGDQIFTDVWGGNRFGIKTVLVTPIGEKEWIITKIKRPLERIVLKQYFKKKEEGKCNS